jgi:hypothetical protein
MRTSSWMQTLTNCALALLLLGPATARAFENEPARIRLSSALLDETVQGLLPSLVRLPPPKGVPSASNRPTLATLTELKYCGATDKGAGRFRALLRLDTAEAAPVIGPGKIGCHGALADLASRLGQEADGAGIAVADVEATWRPWELRLVVVRAEGTSKAAKTRLAAVLERRREFLVVPTAESRIQTESGPIALYAVPSFLRAGVEIAILLGSSGAPAAPEQIATSSPEPRITGEANVAADVPLSFANQLLRQLTWSQPLTIPLNNDEVELRHVSMGGQGAGARARVTLSGNATPGSMRETVRWTIGMSGDPLCVSFVDIAAQTEDCSALGTMAALACRVRNGARVAAAETFAASLTQRYQGAPVHQLISPQTFRASVADQRVILTGDLLRMALGPRGLSATAKLSPP